MNLMTLDSASCWDTNGTPRAPMLNASIDITRADTTTFTPPPTRRSAARRGLNGTTLRIRRPIMVPRPLPHDHQQDGRGNDRRQAPAAVLHEAADDGHGHEGGDGACRESRDASERHKEAVAKTVDQVGQERHNQHQVQNGQAKHRGSLQTVQRRFYRCKLNVCRPAASLRRDLRGLPEPCAFGALRAFRCQLRHRSSKILKEWLKRPSRHS